MRIAVEQRTQAVAANPLDMRAQRALAIAHHSLGRALRAADDMPGALAKFGGGTNSVAPHRARSG